MTSQYQKNLKAIALLVFILLVSGCIDSGARYDYRKQEAFEGQFDIDMSLEEVEAILTQLEGITLRDIYEGWSNGEVTYRYSTSRELYGADYYTFRYSNDLRLIRVVAGELTD